MPGATSLNHPLPVRGMHRRRRYHYLSFRVEGADPEAIAEEANRRAGQGYALFSTVPVVRTDRTDVVLIFARRLRHVKPVAAVEGAPPPTDDQGRPIVTTSEEA